MKGKLLHKVVFFACANKCVIKILISLVRLDVLICGLFDGNVAKFNFGQTRNKKSHPFFNFVQIFVKFDFTLRKSQFI
jgi:hypothetical protein